MTRDKLRAVLAVSVVLLLLLASACKRNHPPPKPDVTGQLTYRPGDTTRLSATATDRDDDLLSYLFAWGDTTSAEWTPDYPSGIAVTRTHVYADSGAYTARAKARDDKGAESEWSTAETVRVGVFLPGVPARPLGSAVGLTGTAFRCSTHAASPYGESLYIQFDWGEELGSWSGPVASDSPLVETHGFDTAGLYAISARACDNIGATSAWSDSLAVAIVEHRPHIPARPSGPSTIKLNDTADYRSVTTDPNGDKVLYVFNWGDGTEDTTNLVRSGDTVTASHAWAATGALLVKAKAKDETGNWSADWSEPLAVTITGLPPEKPITPAGPAYCTTGVACTYRVVTVHPEGGQVEFQFDWGGTLGDWGNRAASGETAAVTHVFDIAGTYAVAVRARDDAGLISEWSDPLSVTAVDIPGGPARNVSLRAETDTTVRLAWSPPVEGLPSHYRVMFRPVGDTFAAALETGDTTCEHDPARMTGDYRVLAQFGAKSFEGADTLSTIPIHSGTTTVGELSGPDKSGCGWPAPNRTAKTYAMDDTAWVDSIDFYVTDFKPGSEGPTYYLASPDLAPTDSGGSVPAGRWQATQLVELPDDQSPLPPVGDSAWTSTVAVAGAPAYAGCHTQQHYFAVVKVTQLRINNEDLRLQAWFQPVRGFRLLRH